MVVDIILLSVCLMEYFFIDGTPATRRTIRKKCATYEGGSGKDRMYLDYIIATVLNFFKKSII